jgi:hypothetical protein
VDVDRSGRTFCMSEVRRRVPIHDRCQLDVLDRGGLFSSQFPRILVTKRLCYKEWTWFVRVDPKRIVFSRRRTRFRIMFWPPEEKTTV